jgi:hypothetical protein
MKMNGLEHVQWVARAKLQFGDLKIVRSAFTTIESLLLTVVCEGAFIPCQLILVSEDEVAHDWGHLYYILRLKRVSLNNYLLE